MFIKIVKCLTGTKTTEHKSTSYKTKNIPVFAKLNVHPFAQ